MDAVFILIILGLMFFFGIDPSTTQDVIGQFGGAGVEQQGKLGTPQDRAGRFVDVVSANINDVWSAKVKGYAPPKVVLYDQGTSTGCGFGQCLLQFAEQPRDMSDLLVDPRPSSRTPGSALGPTTRRRLLVIEATTLELVMDPKINDCPSHKKHPQ